MSKQTFWVSFMLVNRRRGHGDRIWVSIGKSIFPNSFGHPAAPNTNSVFAQMIQQSVLRLKVHKGVITKPLLINWHEMTSDGVVSTSCPTSSVITNHCLMICFFYLWKEKHFLQGEGSNNPFGCRQFQHLSLTQNFKLVKEKCFIMENNQMYYVIYVLLI